MLLFTNFVSGTIHFVCFNIFHSSISFILLIKFQLPISCGETDKDGERQLIQSISIFYIIHEKKKTNRRPLGSIWMKTNSSWIKIE